MHYCAMDGEAGARSLNAGRMNSSEVEMSDGAIVAAHTEMLNTKDSASVMSWIALGYAAKKKLCLLGSGVGGYESLRPHLADDAVVYAVFKVLCGGSPKLVFISSIGPNAGAMVKGRATAHTQSVENALEGTAIGIQAAETEELAPEAVVAKLTKALGAAVTL